MMNNLMLCCHKTGVLVKRCVEKVINNLSTPKALGYSEHTEIFRGLIPLVPLNSRHDDNFDEAGQLVYRSFIAMIPETVYQTNQWRAMDILSFNDGYLASKTEFDDSKLSKSGKIYSVREVVGSLRTGIKYREVKVRFDLQ